MKIINKFLVKAKEKNLGDFDPLPGGYSPGLTEESATSTLTKIFSNTFGVLTLVGGLMFLLYFILGAISWISSHGQQERIQKARDQMTNAAVGLIIVVASFAISFIVGSVLGIDILGPADYILKLGPGEE